MESNAHKLVSIGSAGEMLVELVCRDVGTRNQKVASYLGPFPSGAPAIFIDQAANIGARSIFVGAVGDDAFGQVIKDQITQSEIASDFILTNSELPTGTAFVCYDDDGSRDFVFNISASAAIQIGDPNKICDGLLEFGLDVFHVSGSSLADEVMSKIILSVCRRLSYGGVKISFDPNIRAELLSSKGYLDVVQELTEMCEYYLPSEEDISQLFPDKTFENIAPQLFNGCCEYAVLKRGANGCLGISALGEKISYAGHKVNSVDPTGAGDCFCATFVTTLLAGESFQNSLKYANAAGALATTHVGPMTGNSSRQDIEEYLCRHEETADG